jgi:hypothetical protein
MVSFLPLVLYQTFWCCQLCHQRIPIFVLSVLIIVVTGAMIYLGGVGSLSATSASESQASTTTYPTLQYDTIWIECGICAQNMTGAVLANTMT